MWPTMSLGGLVASTPVNGHLVMLQNHHLSTTINKKKCSILRAHTRKLNRWGILIGSHTQNVLIHVLYIFQDESCSSNDRNLFLFQSCLSGVRANVKRNQVSLHLSLVTWWEGEEGWVTNGGRLRVRGGETEEKDVKSHLGPAAVGSFSFSGFAWWNSWPPPRRAGPVPRGKMGSFKGKSKAPWSHITCKWLSVFQGGIWGK